MPLATNEVELAQQLVQSYSETYHEAEVAELLQRSCQDLGFDQSYVDEAGNTVAIIERGTGPTIMLNGHIDTVALGDESAWPHPPLSGAIADGRLWGRGSCDMKSALACMVFAALDAVDANFQGRIIVSGVVQEEISGLGAWHISRHSEADCVVLGEPSKLKLMLGHRGRIEIEAIVKGRIAHAAKHELGDNALYKAGRLLEQLERLELPQEGILGASSLTPTAITSFPKSTNVVPGEARITIDYRNVPSDNEEAVLARLKALSPETEFRLEENSYSSANEQVMLANQRARAAFLSPGENPWVKQARSSLERSLSAQHRGFAEDVWWFATDAPFLADIRSPKGKPTVVLGFGPGEEELAHTTQESIALEDLRVARAAYRDLLLDFSKHFDRLS